MQMAIIQNSIGIGGRSKVIAEVLRSTTDKFSEVHIHSLSESSDFESFFEYYDVDANSVVPITHSSVNIPSTIYQQLFLNWKVRNVVRDYDVVFNSNNCLRFLPEGPDYIHYIHFPLPATPKHDVKYEQLIYKIGVMPIYLIYFLTSTNFSGTVFTNSEYTRKYSQKEYSNSNPKLLYPPCIDSVDFEGYSGTGVVSVGSFHPNKRQLFQLRVAKQLPEIEFRIVGSKISTSYFRKCQRFKEKHDLKNVELLPNASENQLKEKLDTSSVFLHSMKNERFGISTVEGINHGCIPVVHDSGGQREVVPWDEFRYTTMSECKEILESVINGVTPPESEIRPHLNQFTSETFRKRLRGEF